MQSAPARSNTVQGACGVPESLRNDAAMLEEYKTLRDEILRRLETRSRIVNLALVATVAVWSAALQSAAIAPVLLLYPLLVLALATEWSFQGLSARRLGKHIHEQIEPCLPGLRWETLIRQDWLPPFVSRTMRSIAESSLFMLIQVATVVLAVLLLDLGDWKWPVLVGEAVLLIFTFYLIWSYRGIYRRGLGSSR
jgi:hypothetical protein